MNRMIKMKNIRSIYFALAILLLVVSSEKFSIGSYSPGPIPDTVIDSDTGLIWTVCSMGQTPPTCPESATTETWRNALAYCSGLTLGGAAWRLPNIKELFTIINYYYEAPAVKGSAFPNTPGHDFAYYWTSTTHPTAFAPGGRDRAMLVDFDLGGSDDDLKSGQHYVRCVTGP